MQAENDLKITNQAHENYITGNMNVFLMIFSQILYFRGSKGLVVNMSPNGQRTPK